MGTVFCDKKRTEPTDQATLCCYRSIAATLFAYAPNLKRLVEISGIEPLTSCMPCKRSPS